MTADTVPAASRALSRGVSATWWYTVSAVLFFQAVVILVWTTGIIAFGYPTSTAIVVLVGGALWWVDTIPLLLSYRQRDAESPLVEWRVAAAPFVVGVAFGVTALALTGIWLLAAIPVAYATMLLHWPPRVRARIVVLVTVVLVVLWIVDSRGPLAGGDDRDPAFTIGFFSAALPMMLVLSLWWWDVLVSLDRARASEARLAATQERLRVATDVHDLQGHHLQVIALQLELAERLMPRDPDAALEQLRLARTSVDEARQGTRDLATRFRAVPLTDELANAADLLRAAGASVELDVAPDADAAPPEAFGPIIRETTTNVLRHGGGRYARLALAREGSGWRYEIRNDAGPAASGTDGSGLEGIRRRASEAGGTLTVTRGDEFGVRVEVPA